ncbi:MAG TPA: carboxypeptidase regulatory-like domain-containing protein [Gemmatimonadales bacterium]|nr:carboxypeptidase regulatory-like domain-containing protein [Gemmatimonadales bacterium]
MTRFRRAAAWAIVAVLAAWSAGPLAAQGVTSAAVQGKVTQAGGTPVEGATVIITNTSTGQRFQVQTRAGGSYTLENVPPGGPYTISARGVGFQPNTRSDIQLTLGQRFTADFELTQAVVQVEELTIKGAPDPIINKGRTGASNTISAATIASLPTSSRNFTDFVVTSPQVVATPNGGPSIGGSNNRFNSIQIDGAVNNDLFGLGSTGVPGGQVSARPIPLDAVKEFQILVSPFDVRQSGFTGGLINAVTQSGTNDFHGDAWVSLQNEGLAGKDSAGNSAASFSTTQFGASLGGPIVKDKAQFFVSADIQKRNVPYGGQLLQGTDATLGATIADSMRTEYGVDAGTIGSFTETTPGTNLFGKITAQAGQNGQLELSENYVKASDDNFISRSVNGNYQLSGGGYQIQNHSSSTRLKWTSIFGNGYNNELIAGYQAIRDNRPPNTNFATVIVDAGVYNWTTGAERYSQANSLNQDIFELSDNLTFDLNANNRLTVGTHNEFFKFHNVFFPQSIGQWSFASADSFYNALPSQYTRALTGQQAGIAGGRTDGPVADFNVRQFGLYAQDAWTPVANMTITGGIRVDDPTFPVLPPTNQGLLTDANLVTAGYHLDTGVFPSGNLLFSPRVGFNYDVHGDGSLQLRGGVGIFSGRPPYVWLSNAYGNTGLEQAQLTCSTAGTMPFFSLDSSYTQCAGGGGTSTPIPTINIFDKNFKFPQALRFALGADKRLPWGVTASVDLSYARNRNTLYLQDLNLTGPVGTLTGEGGRVTYGTFSGTSVTPSKVTSSFANIIMQTNKSKDYSYSGSLQLAKNAGNMSFTAGYTYSRAYDLISQTSSIAFSNYGYATLDGTLENRNVTTSFFDRPNKITFSGTYHFPHALDLSLIYIGVSGAPFGYSIAGDVNADGVGGGSQQNDLFYVPKDSADITLVNGAQWDTLNTFINGQKCLSSQRGKIMGRDSCRNPWSNYLNANLSWTPQIGSQRLQISADVFNLLHFISSDWGVIRSTTINENSTILKKSGAFDVTNDRNSYTLNLPRLNTIDINQTRWRVVLGAKWMM